jgi:hypothetical protein
MIGLLYYVAMRFYERGRDLLWRSYRLYIPTVYSIFLTIEYIPPVFEPLYKRIYYIHRLTRTTGTTAISSGCRDRHYPGWYARKWGEGRDLFLVPFVVPEPQAY